MTIQLDTFTNEAQFSNGNRQINQIFKALSSNLLQGNVALYENFYQKEKYQCNFDIFSNRFTSLRNENETLSTEIFGKEENNKTVYNNNLQVGPTGFSENGNICSLLTTMDQQFF